MFLSNTLVILAISVVAVSAGRLNYRKFLKASNPDHVEFMKLVEKHGITINHPEELHARFANYQKTKETIKELAKKHPHAEFGHGKFSLLHNDEKRKYFMDASTFHNTRHQRTRAKEVNLQALKPAPAAYDYRTEGKVTPVKNQKQCGSCWAFAATAAIESQYLIFANVSRDLAEQTVVNCALGLNKDGCWKATSVLPAYEYVQKNGFPTESVQPYYSGKSKTSGKCVLAPSNEDYFVSGYRQWGKNESTYAQQLFNYGPASIIIYPTTALGLLKSGYLNSTSLEDCMRDNNKLHDGGVMHAMTLVGYTPDYWIVKNSWGPDACINGYVHMKRGENYCGITMEVASPIVDSSTQWPKSASSPKPFGTSTPAPEPSSSKPDPSSTTTTTTLFPEPSSSKSSATSTSPPVTTNPSSSKPIATSTNLPVTSPTPESSSSQPIGSSTNLPVDNSTPLPALA